ncbi:protein kinase-like protein [Leptomonas pyrrhocoris]|uniref:Protein kinase-like protein n=1 Tax=Leptomonas pyrrhocoris TaxID=157538 RepID=A0A0M9G174_LEPPY|nr:protein kinase-like protein [Leptomonas pyrrhocoris]XP_015658750.1 protein kinase-like protein [Leptomonas pyrrhocoris]KPA80310.1 protein kinase-like protein [Leptomonas pyrrhocoris]KPA80311.1 protein kinase-like protein [Leptomonas pyrrhocoris]|eukprot:XP_015658749.1 protein kinase-like protein [Leptomonas pyrrhocoris]
MLNASTEVHPSVSPRCGIACANVDATSSEGSAALSTLGCEATCANALSASAVRGTTWRDVASVAPSHLLLSTSSSMMAGDPGLTAEMTRTETQIGPSLSCDETQLATAAINSSAQHAVLAKGINRFHELVTHLPSLTTTAASVFVNATADSRSSKEEQPSSLKSTIRPQLSYITTAAVGGGVGASPSSRNATPLLAAQLPASTVPTHCDRMLLMCPQTEQCVNDVPATLLHRRVCATADPLKAGAAKSELARLQRSGSGCFFTAARRRERELGSADGARAGVGRDDDSRLSTASLRLPNSVSSPFSPPSLAFQANVWVTARDSERTDTNSSTLQAREAFQLYLDHTRRTVLSTEASAADRAKAFDELTTHSRELFDLLDEIYTSFDGPDRRNYSMLKVLPFDEAFASCSSLEPLVRPGAGAAAATAATTSASSDDEMRNAPIEPLSLTARTYAAHLPPLGTNATTLRLLDGFERVRRSSFNSCSDTSVAYLDVVNNYFVLKLLGVGATGRVYLTVDRNTNRYYAMKTVPKRTRRTAAHLLTLRPHSCSSEPSVLRPAVPMSSLPDNGVKLPPRYTTGGSAADAVAAPIASANGTSSCSIVRTTFLPSTAEHSGKQQMSSANAPDLQEADMEGFSRSASHTSNLVIPYTESIVGGESPSSSMADGTSHNMISAVVVDGGLSWPAEVRPSIPFASQGADPLHLAANNGGGSCSIPTTRPSIVSSPLHEAVPAAPRRKDTSVTPAEGALSAVEREIRVMRRVQNHQHVVQLKEVIDDDDEDCAHMIMTYAASGPLTTAHSFDPAFGGAPCDVVRPFTRCARLLWQLADALIYVHRHHIVHNDVKPDNVLLTDSDSVLLTDFGESVLVPKRVQSATGARRQRQHSPRADDLNASVAVPHNRWKLSRTSADSFLGGGGGGGDFNEQSVSYRTHGGCSPGFSGNLARVSQVMATENSFQPDSSMFLAVGVDGDGRLNDGRIMAGSPAFAAPELIDNSTCSYSSDTWSFGVVMYAVVFGRLPFAGPSISDTFGEILHGALTFPPLDKMPQSAELTEAAYEQWVMLCSRLLVREPQRRPSLHTILRHPFFRSMVPLPSTPQSSIMEALPNRRRSMLSARRLSADDPNSRLRSAQSRRGMQLGPHMDDLSPISRTVRSSPRSVNNELLSPVGLSSAFPLHKATVPEKSDTRTAHAPSNPTPPSSSFAKKLSIPTPPRMNSTALARVPAPPATQTAKDPGPPSKRSFFSAKQEDDAPTATDPNIIAQVSSLMNSKGTDTQLPRRLSYNDGSSAALPAQPQRLLETPAMYRQSADLAGSGRTVSPREKSFFPDSNGVCNGFRRAPSGQTPVSATLMMDCTAVPSTTPALGVASPSDAATVAQVTEKEEMRRLGLALRDAGVTPATSRVLPHPDKAQRDSGGSGGDGNRGVNSPTTAAATPSQLHPEGTSADAESGDRIVHEVSVSGATRRPSDDQGRSSSFDDALSRQDATSDYYSYWNDSDEIQVSSSSSCSSCISEEAAATEVAAPVSQRATECNFNPHLPLGPLTTRAPVRRCVASAKQRMVVPVLSSHEEVQGRPKQCSPSMVSIVEVKSMTAEERRLGDPRLSREHGRSTAGASESSKKTLRLVADAKRDSSKSPSTCSVPSGDKQHSNSLSIPEASAEEVRTRRTPTPTLWSQLKHNH